MKDKFTGNTILKWAFKEGLYQLSELGKDPSASVFVKDNWHGRLGHPSSKVFNKV